MEFSCAAGSHGVPSPWNSCASPENGSSGSRFRPPRILRQRLPCPPSEMRLANPKCLTAIPCLEELEPRKLLSVLSSLTESFDGTSAGQLPDGWSRWSSSASLLLRV